MDPAIPLPDNAIRRTKWWAIVNRLPRPVMIWITNVALAQALIIGPAGGNYPPDVYLATLFLWAAGLFGLTTYEKRLGIA